MKKLSLWRLFIFLLALAGITGSVVYGWEHWQESRRVAANDPWFAAYVDITSLPHYPFEQLGTSDTPNVVLSFIVSHPEDPCLPTWGGYYTLDQALPSLDLDRRIARLQQHEGKVAISFGGAYNSELALHCQDADRLRQAYLDVIDRYKVDTIDLDLENESLTDLEAAKRRASVIASLQRDFQSQGKFLSVWLTLPVAPQGLTESGTQAIATMLGSGVDLAGVNVMVMNYGSSWPVGAPLSEAAFQALTETHRQLGVLYHQADNPLSSRSLWRKIGATPMIGQNDIVLEVFSLDDAKALNHFATSKGIGRMSMWSANRDKPCGENYVDLTVVSDVCSGVIHPELSYTQALSFGFSGTIAQLSPLLEDEEVRIVADNPATSPYQIWSETGAYLKGTKVVWRGHVYEAKWWTKNDLPDNPVLQAWETPWQLIGPVLPGEKPIPKPTLPPGTYPEWTGTDIYEADDRVLFESLPYQAKWWNQGQSPAASAANPDSSPWLAIPDHEVLAILESITPTPTLRPVTPRPASPSAEVSVPPLDSSI